MAYKIKRVFAVARNAYIDWITNPRMFLFFFAAMVVINSYITPLPECAQAGVNSPLNIFEGFLSLCSNTHIISTIFSLLFIVLICDCPKMSANDTFVLVRTSKKSRIAGQIIFAFFASLTYITALFAVITLYTAPHSFFTNAWSTVTRTMDGDKDMAREFGVVAPIYSNMFNHSHPVDALINSVALMTLSLTVIALIILLFNLKGQKILGIVAGISLVATGYTLISMRHITQWLFPMAHSMIVTHNTPVIKTIPLWESYAYFFAVIAALTALAVMFINKYSFRFNDSSN